MEQGSVTERIADFVVALHERVLDEPVAAAAARCVTDGLGVAVAALAEHPSSALLQPDGRGQVDPLADATQLGSPDRVDHWTAALMNGTLIHSLDFDDGFPEGALHPGASIVPAALALGEHVRATDEDILRAIVVGYEVSMRIAAAAIDGLVPNGVHPTSLCGTVGAAATAAFLAGQTKAMTRDTLGLSTSFASGLMQGHTDGSSVKKLHGGWGATAGLRAAWFAARGFTGPREAIEGRYGLLPAHVGTGRFDEAMVTAGLGEEWLIERVALKPYPCCHLLHAPIEAVHELRGELSSVGEIEHVEVRCPPMAMDLVVNPRAEKARPSSSYGAKFSLPFGVAAALVDDTVGLSSFDTARLADDRFAALIDKIDCTLDEKTEYPPTLDAEIRITLRDGRTLATRVTGPSGSSGRPLPDEQVRQKFVGNCAYLGISATDAVRDLADRLLSGRDVVPSVQALNTLVIDSAKGVV